MSSGSSQVVDIHVDRQTEIGLASPSPARPRQQLLFVEEEGDIIAVPRGIPPRPPPWPVERFPGWPWSPRRSPGWTWTPRRSSARRTPESSPGTQFYTPGSSRPPGTPPPRAPARFPVVVPNPPPPPPPPPPAPAAAPNFNRLKIVGCVCVVIVIAAAFSGGFMIHRGNKRHDTAAGIDCQITMVVARDGTGNFSTVSEAVQASPDESPVRVCIYVRAGTYMETLSLLSEKTNLALIGEGADKTTLSSDQPAQPTLANDGNNLLVRDLKIVNTADEGTVVDNWGRHTVFYRCEVHGRNAILHVEAKDQFYRECKFYGQNHIISGYGRAFFQKSSFFGENPDANQTATFLMTSAPSSYTSSTSLFIFHRCHFVVLESTWVLSGPLSAVSVVLLQSDLDASLGGYYLPDLSPENDTFYAIYKNIAHGDAMKIEPPFVHRLGDVLAADQFSLASFFNNMANWIPQGVAYDLAL